MATYNSQPIPLEIEEIIEERTAELKTINEKLKNENTVRK